MRNLICWSAGLLLLCFFLFSLPPSLTAQTSLGEIRGTVQDSTGAVIPAQNLTLVNQDTNQTRTTISTDSGLYSFPSVAAGNYLMTVERAGFKRFEGKIVLRVGQEAIVNIVLEVASSQVTVEVQAVTPVIETSGSTLSDVKESERIKTLPLNGREITTLFTLTAGVTRTNGTQINGVQPGSVMFLGDGVSMEDRYTGDMSRVNPALEGIQEFRIETLNSTAQYSKPATISYITKSGNNTLHGAAFETYRSNAFYARDPFSRNPQPPLQRREFGASLGGPNSLRWSGGSLARLWAGPSASRFYIMGKTRPSSSLPTRACASLSSIHIIWDLPRNLSGMEIFPTTFPTANPRSSRSMIPRRLVWIRPPGPTFGTSFQATRFRRAGYPTWRQRL